MPTNGRKVPTGLEWAYEIKHDGFRLHLPSRVRVYSRRGIDHSDRAPGIAEALI